VNAEEGGDDHHVVADILHRDVAHLDADAAGHLREIQPSDLHPLVPVLDQKIAAARIAAEVLAEALGQPLVARGVHLDVLVEQRADEGLALRPHRTDSRGERNVHVDRWNSVTRRDPASAPGWPRAGLVVQQTQHPRAHPLVRALT